MLFINSDSVFVWTGLRDSITGVYINDATLTGLVMELDGTEVLEFAFSYISASQGDYQGVITADHSNDLTPGQEYIVEITATHSGSTTTKRERHKASWLGYK